MKTQNQRRLHNDEVALPRFLATNKSSLLAFIALVVVVLAAPPQLKAYSIPDKIYDFKEFLIASSTNSGANNGGAEALCLVYVWAGVNPFGMGYGADITGGATLFGTASLGGSSGQGTVYAVGTDGTGFTVLHNFSGGSDGGFPTAGVILSGKTLYGTTENGGSSGNGTVFAVGADTGFTVLHNFTARNHASYTNSDGANPTAALILAGDTLYGTASNGGSANQGTVFSLNTNGTGFTVLHSFAAADYDPNFNLTNSDGANPPARLLLSGDTLYGTATRGGSGGAGTVFALNPDGTGFRLLHNFTAVDLVTFTNSDGANPQAGLILSGDTLYGTAFQGGNSRFGTVFAVNTNGTVFSNLYNFTGGSDGAKPAAELVLATNTLIGTASAGGNVPVGSGGEGTVFTLNTNGTGFAVLYSFTAGNYDPNSSLTNSDGANPQAGLALSGNSVYGTTSYGGNGGNGTVFSLSLLPTQQLTILGVTLSGTNLVINGSNGQSGRTYVTLMSADLSLPLNNWTPAATNILSATGNFTFTATNAVDANAAQRFYILQVQ